MRSLSSALLAVLLLPGCGGGGGGGGGNPPGSPGPTPGSPGTLDTTFGGTLTGKVATPVGSGDDQIRAMAIQADQKIVVGGYSHNGSNKDFAVARYNVDGTLDATFGSGGEVTTAIGSADEEIWGLALQGDGKIVAVGYRVAGSEYDWALARYNSDGSLDTTFDSDGRVVTSALDLYVAHAVAIQGDGKIVVGGTASPGGTGVFTIARYNTDGSLDTNFDTDGIVKVTTSLYPPDECTAVVIQFDQKIVGIGRSNVLNSDTDPCVVRLNSDGSLDTTFDTDGVMLFDFPDNAFGDEAYGVGITSTGSIVLCAGVWTTPTYSNFGVARCSSTGVPDSTFDGDGKVITEIGNSTEEAFAMAIQSNDKIITAGFTHNNMNEDFALIRYNTDGSLDTTFDVDGILTLIFGTGDERAQAVALQSDGRIVVAGYAWNGTDFDFAVARIWP